MEPCEKEIIIRTSNVDEVWHIYISDGALKAQPFLRNMTVTGSVTGGLLGVIPKAALKVRLPGKKKVLAPEHLAKLQEARRKRTQGPSESTQVV